MHSIPPSTSESPSSLIPGPESSQSPSAAHTRWAGTGFIALSAAGFASLTILGKVALEAGLSLTTILSLRFGGAALLLLFAVGVLRRQRVIFGRRLMLILFLLGAVGYAGQSALYFSALARNPAAITSILLYIYPVFVGVLEWLFDRRIPTSRQWLAMGISSIGVLLVLGTAGTGVHSIDLLGAVFVLASAIWYAGYIYTSSRYLSSAGPWVTTAWISVGAMVSFTIMGALTNTLDFHLSTQALMIVLVMIFASTILALGAFLAGVERVGPTTASLLSTLEPVFTIILAVILLGESLSWGQLFGGALILAAVLLLTIPGNHRKKKT